MEQILTTGNISDLGSMGLLKALCEDVRGVKGEFDLESTGLPTTLVVEHDDFRIGVVSGFTVIPNDDPGALLVVARKLNADLLVWGGSQKPEAFQLADRFFLNPGSVSGVPPASLWLDNKKISAGFCLVDIQGRTCTMYIYSLENNDVKVEKILYEKP